MKYILLVSSLLSLLVSSTVASYGISTMLASTSQKFASSSMINPSSAKSSASVLSSTIVAPTSSADVSSTISQKSPSSQTAASHQTARSSTPIVPTPSKSSARPSTSVPPTGKPTKTTPTPLKPIEFYFKKNSTSNVTCVAVSGIIKLTVTANGKTYPPMTVTRKPTNTNGTCKTNVSNTSSINAFWDNYTMRMEFKFFKDNWFLQTIEVEVYGNIYHGDVNANKTFKSMTADGLYQGPVDGSYNCTAEKEIPLSGKKGKITVDFQSLMIRPFPANGTGFPNPKSCPPSSGGSEPSNNSIVPIAVGCALAGLIVIVLIAYLIGRRKSNKGYQQV